MYDLERLIKDLNLKKQEFAELFNVGHNAVSNNIKTNNLPARWILKLQKEYPSLNVNEYLLKNNLPEYEKEYDSPKQIPFYDTEVFATISPAMSDLTAMKPETFVNIPMFSQGEYALPVSGHSMKGYINHGDWIVVRRITNKNFIVYGEPYLVITKSDNFKTVKFVKEGDSPETLTLVPYNIEQFDPQEIEKTEVLEIYQIVGLFRKLQ